MNDLTPASMDKSDHVSDQTEAATLVSSVEHLSLSESDPHVVGSNPECVFEPNETPEEAEERIKLQEAIRRALDEQTNILYEQYAREQHPKDVQKQRELVLEMQEQYFQRYMNEVYPSQLVHQQEQFEQWCVLRQADKQANVTEGGDAAEAPSDPGLSRLLPLIPATIWTRKDIGEFKQEILKTQRECCIKIGSLATATVRVPTHAQGTSIFWEFATDHYDLGFGLYFEWDLEPQPNITVSVSESSDEEDEDDEEDELDAERRRYGREGTDPEHAVGAFDLNEERTSDQPAKDLERGHHMSNPRLPTDELIPIYRRDCHTEVYCGSHQYPGVGVYVFKFDNSFSLWRSKWLYYRIYYAQ